MNFRQLKLLARSLHVSLPFSLSATCFNELAISSHATAISISDRGWAQAGSSCLRSNRAPINSKTIIPPHLHFTPRGFKSLVPSCHGRGQASSRWRSEMSVPTTFKAT